MNTAADLSSVTDQENQTNSISSERCTRIKFHHRLCRASIVPIFLLLSLTASGRGPTEIVRSGRDIVSPNGPGASCSWSSGTNLPSVAVRSVGVFFPANGKFYAMGGRSSDAVGSDFTHPFEYDPDNGTWTTKSAIYPDTQVNNMACGVLTDAGNSYIYCVGGSAATQTVATSRVFRYDPVADVISAVAAPWPGNPGDVLPGGFSVFSNKLYILGGFEINVQMMNQIYEFTPGTNAWVQKTAVLPVPLGFIPTTTIGNHIYTGGGSTFTGGIPTDSDNAFAYDPAADTIATIANIPRATGETRALNVGNKMWVLGGGRTAPNPSNEVDIYDPVANTWSTGTPFTTARRNFPADTDGTITWIAGGYDNSGVTPLASMEIFRCICPGDQYTIATGTDPIVPGTTDIGLHADDGEMVVNLPFAFQLYDQTFNSVNVDSNGRLDFVTINEPGGFTTRCLPAPPNQGPYDLTIFPLWEDMRTDIVGQGCTSFPGGTCGVFTSVSGSAPNRTFNIEWRTVLFADNTATQNFEVRLYESDPNKRFDVIIGALNTANANQLYVSGVQGNGGAGIFTQDFCTNTPSQSVSRSYTLTGCQSSLLGNISTRLQVQTGNNVLIGGFIISGTQPKRVILRAIGPSLPVPGVLINPFLELRDSGGNLILSNDNWRSDQEAEIIATGIPPTNDLESAIVATLPANNSAYTAIVSGTNNGTGVGLVEVYDLDRTVDSKLANISTRGFVETADNVLIGGLIVVGQTQLRVIVRAIGPSLPVPGALANPTLELHDGNGALIAANDDWRSDQEAEIIATGIPPSNDLESAIVRNLAPGNYTAIVRGVNDGTGVGLVEVYGLN